MSSMIFSGVAPIHGNLTVNEAAADMTENPGAILIRHTKDGKEAWVYAYNKLGSAMVQSTPYQVEYSSTLSTNPAFVDITDATCQKVIGVPQVAVTSTNWAWFQIMGKVPDLVTPGIAVTDGHGLITYDTAIKTIAAAWSEHDTEWGIALETVTTGVTAMDTWMAGREFLGTT